ncbi:hypothetical protein [Polyangium fumosum]|uniref:Uncharacterized protein n=1 Tax=Polyangium fumosum TaxID=889272 RepID=A0A4U1J001_9BACT|nr:hypothetical protein [Polyangium fumosum]TKC99679.1 hypothetical protein E8A74_36985 [Polyangium fumosum]
MPVTPIPVGSLVFDCSALGPYLVDLPPRGMLGLLVERPGYPSVVGEILANQAGVGPKAGVTQEEVEAIMLDNAHIDDIDAILPAARKLVELLEESRAFYDNDRQRRVHAIANLIEGRARTTGVVELLAKYEKTRAYRSATGVKGLKTRKANKKKAETETPAPTTPPIVRAGTQ